MINPAQFNDVLSKASDQQLMALLKRPDKIHLSLLFLKSTAVSPCDRRLKRNSVSKQSCKNSNAQRRTCPLRCVARVFRLLTIWVNQLVCNLAHQLAHWRLQ